MAYRKRYGRRRRYRRPYRRYYNPLVAMAQSEYRAKLAADPTVWGYKADAAGTQAALKDAFKKGTYGNRTAFGLDFQSATEKQRINRALAGYRGMGDYRGYLPRIAGAVWHGLQGAFSGMRGGIPGAISGAINEGVAGWRAGANLSKMIGWGDYGPVSTNKIIGSSEGPQQQIMVNDDSLTGDIYFSHTEYIGNLSVTTPASPASGTTAFQLLSFDLNPGLKSFPFLSQIAQNFELYQWIGLIFQYKPLSGEFGASSVSNTLGKIVMATKYGVTQNTPFGSMIEMQNYDYANSTKPSCGIVHGVETAPSQNLADLMLVRTGTPDPTAPRVLYDLGRFYIATEGIPYNGANQTIVLGELWVTYRLRLSRAKLWDSLGESIAYQYIEGASSASSITSTITKNNGSIGVTFPIVISGSSNTITFPRDINQGTYLLNFSSIATAATTAHVQFNSPVNCTVLFTAWSPDNGTGATANVGRDATAVIRINSPNQLQASINIQASANVAATYRLAITQVDPNLID